MFSDSALNKKSNDIYHEEHEGQKVLKGNSRIGCAPRALPAFMRAMFFMVSLCAVLFLLPACENGIVGTGNQPTTKPEDTKQGVAQKGPFEIGSNIQIVIRPGPDYVETETVQVQTLDAIGSFEFDFEPDTLYEISVTGRHFNEITGELSGEALTLNSTYYHEKDIKPFVSINILTHLIHSRINYLIGNDGLTPAEATDQASHELLNALTDVIFAEHLDGYSFNNMTVYNLEDTDPNANAVLLFISAAFYQQSMTFPGSPSMTQMLTEIAADLEKDGEIDGKTTPDTEPDPTPAPADNEDNKGQQYISSLDFAARLLDPEQINTNLTQYSMEKTGSALPVPDISFLLDNDADGITNDVDSDDDGDGIPDNADGSPYQFEIIPVPQTFTTSQGVAIDLDLQFNTPEHPENNTIYLSPESDPAHGQLTIMNTNVTYTPAPGFTGSDSFSYSVNCLSLLNCQAVTVLYSSDVVNVSIEVLSTNEQ